jgi:phenylalanyl-tRNA synthetase beta chain
MNLSLEWLATFVELGLPPAAVRDLLTARVATVDAVEPLRADLAGIVVGRVLSAERHPDSDHLWVTTVDAGGDAPLDVVCGAPNVMAGVRYPFAPVGTTMPGGLRIESRKIRGQRSVGMLCSARELGLGDSHEGILALETTAAPGTPLLDVLPSDVRLVLDVLPNRPDLLSHRGVARELAAALDRPLRDPVVGESPVAALGAGTRAGPLAIGVEHPGDAPTYLAVAIRGVRVGPSPEWLVRRLAAVGVRSINSVVDVTNYVLHGYGQPIHAFDLARLSGGLTVRRARPGDRLRTLDGVDRGLAPSMIVIADEVGPQAIAGVIGGRGSEVTDATIDILVEIATFDPMRVRATRRQLGISTDASYRFERGVPPELPVDVYAATMALLAEVAGGTIDGPPALVAAPVSARPAIRLRAAAVATLLGTVVPSSESARLLAPIGFTSRAVGDDLLVTPPWFRLDVVGEPDLLEEVARLRGYDAVPDLLRPFRPTTTVDDPLVAVTGRLRETMVGLGYVEARPMPFVADAGPFGVRMRNPLADTESFLRSDLLGPLARRAEYNLAQRIRDIRLFEVGTVFRRGSGGRPAESTAVAALLMGARRPPHFTEPHPPAFDEWDARAVAERVAGAAFPRATVACVADDASPGVLWQVHVDGAARGVVRRLALDAPPWAAPAFGVELTIGSLSTADVAAPGAHAYRAVRADVPTHPRYVAPPAMPAVDRDVSLLVADGLAGGAGVVDAVLRRAGAPLVESVVLIGEYRGAGVPDDARSVTWRLTFRDPTRTLTEKEVDAAQRKLLRTLETELGVRQRTI